jgi:hypothetical protein
MISLRLSNISNPIYFTSARAYSVSGGENVVKKHIGKVDWGVPGQDSIFIECSLPDKTTQKEFLVIELNGKTGSPILSILLENSDTETENFYDISIGRSGYRLSTRNANYLYHARVGDSDYLSKLHEVYHHITEKDFLQSYVGDTVFECIAYLLYHQLIEVRHFIGILKPFQYQPKPKPVLPEKQKDILPDLVPLKDALSWGVNISGVRTVRDRQSRHHFLDYLINYHSKIDHTWSDFLQDQASKLESVTMASGMVRKTLEEDINHNFRHFPGMGSFILVDDIQVLQLDSIYYFPYADISPFVDIGKKIEELKQNEETYRKKASIVKTLAEISKTR